LICINRDLGDPLEWDQSAGPARNKTAAARPILE